MSWNSVNDKIPDAGMPVLVYSRGEYYIGTHWEGEPRQKFTIIQAEENYDVHPLTVEISITVFGEYWMELPEPPRTGDW